MSIIFYSHINSSPPYFWQNDADAYNAIMIDLHLPRLTIKLLYITPEQIIATNPIIQILTMPNDKKQLARFVFDEAHCVSDCSRHFRPAYLRMNVLKCTFQEVPAMMKFRNRHGKSAGRCAKDFKYSQL